MTLHVELSPRALRDLAGLEKGAAKGVLDDLEILRSRPWPGPPKVKKLSGHKDLYRLRTGDYRSIFEPIAKSVVILRIMDRKDFEKALKNL